MYQTWHSSQAKNKGSNIYSFINPEADKLMETIRTEFDFNKRKEMTQKICDIIYQEQPITLLWAQPALMARIDRYDNVEFNRQRPCVALPEWVVKGSGVKPIAGRPGTIMKDVAN